MAEIRGKFITLSCELLETKPQAKEIALKSIRRLTGKDYKDLEPEGWYDVKIIQTIYDALRETSTPIIANAGIKLIGQKIFPTIKKTEGFPSHLKTPIDFLKYEVQSFKENHRGSDLKQRKIIEAKNGKVIMEATSPGYDCTLIEGVFLGILDMCGVNKKQVTQTKCVKKGDQDCEYLITWE